MTLTKFYFILLAVFVIIKSTSAEFNAFVENKKCGIMYSEKKFSGSTFNLDDFDQSVNIKKDYRTFISGWPITASIKVEDNCTMNVCTGTYFQGNCYSLGAGLYHDSQFTADINSANCSCERMYKCLDIFIPENDFSCGRAYIRTSCNSSDSEYLLLQSEGTAHNFSSMYASSIDIIVLRTVCYLRVWTEPGKQEETYAVNMTTETAPERIGSYECICDDDEFIPPVNSPSNTPLRKLPSTLRELLVSLSLNETITQHPGLQAAFVTSKNGKNFRNVYILLIGEAHPTNIGLHGCTWEKDEIGECSFSVTLEHLGVQKAGLQVIYANVAPMEGDKGEEEEDNRWAATLVEYLSDDVDLKDSIPNAVILYHSLMNDTTFTEEGSRFQRKLRFLNSLRPLIVHENYSNVIFYLWGLDDLTDSEQRNPEESIKSYENAIRSKWTFPEPIIIVPRTNWDDEKPYINGYQKMENGEYNFKNLQEALKLISKKGGDPLGNAVFSRAYPRERQRKGTMYSSKSLLSADSSEVRSFNASSTLFIESKAKVKRLLQAQNQALIALCEHSSSPRAGQTIKIGDKNEQNQDVQNMQKHLESQMKALILKMERKIEQLFQEEKRARQNDMESLKMNILQKIRIDLDKTFE